MSKKELEMWQGKFKLYCILNNIPTPDFLPRTLAITASAETKRADYDFPVCIKCHFKGKSCDKIYTLMYYIKTGKIINKKDWQPGYRCVEWIKYV